MNTSFFKRQRTWVGILLAGLVITISSIFFNGYGKKADIYLPLQKYSDSNDTDTSVLLLSGFNFRILLFRKKAH